MNEQKPAEGRQACMEEHQETGGGRKKQSEEGAYREIGKEVRMLCVGGGRDRDGVQPRSGWPSWVPWGKGSCSFEKVS